MGEVPVPNSDNVVVVPKNNTDEDDDRFNFPPGFRFCPSDEELIRCYLQRKVLNQILPLNRIHEVNLYQYTPRELSVNYPTVGEKEWYFFTPRDRKYPNGARPNRAAGSGFWKATGADKPVTNKELVTVGFRKALVFYEGKPPRGEKTNWIMHEYRVKTQALKPPRAGVNNMRLDDWVLCRIYNKADKLEKSTKHPLLETVEEASPPPKPVKLTPPYCNPTLHNDHNDHDPDPDDHGFDQQIQVKPAPSPPTPLHDYHNDHAYDDHDHDDHAYNQQIQVKPTPPHYDPTPLLYDAHDNHGYDQQSRIMNGIHDDTQFTFLSDPEMQLFHEMQPFHDHHPHPCMEYDKLCGPMGETANGYLDPAFITKYDDPFQEYMMSMDSITNVDDIFGSRS